MILDIALGIVLAVVILWGLAILVAVAVPIMIFLFLLVIALFAIGIVLFLLSSSNWNDPETRGWALLFLVLACIPLLKLWKKTRARDMARIRGELGYAGSEKETNDRS